MAREILDRWHVIGRNGVTEIGQVDGETMDDARRAAKETLGLDGGYYLRRMVADMEETESDDNLYGATPERLDTIKILSNDGWEYARLVRFLITFGWPEDKATALVNEAVRNNVKGYGL